MQDGTRDLPERYHDDRLRVVAVDPNRLWVYWDEGTAVRRLASVYLPDGWEEAPRLLRVRGGWDDQRLLPCQSGHGSYYVNDLHTGASYRVEYGVNVRGGFVPLLEASVQLPGATMFGGKRERKQPESLSSYSIYTQG